MKRPALVARFLPPYILRTTRDHIACTVDTLVGKLMYYDRKEDESLPVHAIEDAIKAGVVTADEIVELFAFSLKSILGEPVDA